MNQRKLRHCFTWDYFTSMVSVYKRVQKEHSITSYKHQSHRMVLPKTKLVTATLVVMVFLSIVNLPLDAILSQSHLQIQMQWWTWVLFTWMEFLGWFKEITVRHINTFVRRFNLRIQMPWYTWATCTEMDWDWIMMMSLRRNCLNRQLKIKTLLLSICSEREVRISIKTSIMTTWKINSFLLQRKSTSHKLSLLSPPLIDL